MSQSYGLGAMAYFRRVVENAVNSLLDLVDEAAKADGDDDALSAVREARESHIAEDKLRIVADHLPRTLRPYGVNPLALLHDQFSHGIHARQDLEDILNLGGSAWMVAPNGRGLSRRVDRSAVDAAKLVMSNGSRAAKILGEAWQHVYGRNPNPSEGYHQAVRAAETAACRVIIPADPAGSLGKAIAALKHAPAGKFATVFTELDASDPLVAVRGLMELLWKQHIDRHGTADEEIPLSVSQAEAEAALFASVALVQWFERGVIMLREKTS